MRTKGGMTWNRLFVLQTCSFNECPAVRGSILVRRVTERVSQCVRHFLSCSKEIVGSDQRAVSGQSRNMVVSQGMDGRRVPQRKTRLFRKERRAPSAIFDPSLPPA